MTNSAHDKSYKVVGQEIDSSSVKVTVIFKYLNPLKHSMTCLVDRYNTLGINGCDFQLS